MSKLKEVSDRLDRELLAKAKTHRERIAARLEITRSKDFLGLRHRNAFMRGHPIASMILAAADYADTYRERYPDYGIGKDYVLGPEWRSIVRSIRALLNGDIGQMDGGALDATLADMESFEGFDPDGNDIEAHNE